MNSHPSPISRLWRSSAPLFIVSAITLTSLLIAFTAARITHSPLRLLNSIEVSFLDFRDFYEGAEQVIKGESLYSVRRFVTPPLFAYLLAPFTGLGVETAMWGFAVVNLFAIIAGLSVTSRWVSTANRGAPRLELAGVIVATFLSYPALFLLLRGNIDGLVFFAMMLSLFYWSKRERLSGALLAVAVALKVYPCVLLLRGVIEQRKGWLFTTAISLTGISLFTFTESLDFFRERILLRAGTFYPRDNMSFSSAIYHSRVILLQMFGVSGAPSYPAQISRDAGMLSFCGLSVITGLIHFKLSRERSQLLRFAPFIYLPLMVGFPAHVYPYSHTINAAQIFLLCELWRIARSLKAKICIIGMSILLGLSFIHMYSLAAHLDMVNIFAIPPLANLGYFLLLISFFSQGDRLIESHQEKSV